MMNRAIPSEWRNDASNTSMSSIQTTGNNDPPVPTTPRKQQRTESPTPFVSPSPAKKRTYFDRFIPARGEMEISSNYDLHTTDIIAAKTGNSAKKEEHDDISKVAFDTILKAELFGVGSSSMPTTPIKSSQNNVGPSGSIPFTSPTVRRNLFQFQKTSVSLLRDSPLKNAYSLSPISQPSQSMLASPRKNLRQIQKTPFKVLDAPDLQDDFYLNLVDWSSLNVLGVGLGNCVYMWNATTCKVTKLCDLSPYDNVTSLSWMQRGTHLAIGTEQGWVQLWDVQKQKKIRAITGHRNRVGVLAWNDHILSSGSRDKSILHRDVRVANSYIKKLTSHRQEICGLKWNTENQQLASGGNDNRLYIWDKLNETPTLRFTDHKAAVKAISWSPHQHGLLASGGGTQDKHIRFWNTITGTPLNAIDTGSQVCNLAWSKNANELVSTHGYSQNQIVVWKYPSMTPLATLTGHTSRVLYLSLSPDGQTIVTGAGDETLRFWNVFNKSREASAQRSLLHAFSHIR